MPLRISSPFFHLDLSQVNSNSLLTIFLFHHIAVTFQLYKTFLLQLQLGSCIINFLQDLKLNSVRSNQLTNVHNQIFLNSSLVHSLDQPCRLVFSISFVLFLKSLGSKLQQEKPLTGYFDRQ